MADINSGPSTERSMHATQSAAARDTMGAEAPTEETLIGVIELIFFGFCAG